MLTMDNNRLEQMFQKIPTKRARIDTPFTEPFVMNSKRPVKPPRTSKVEQPIDENKNTSYMSIYL